MIVPVFERSLEMLWGIFQDFSGLLRAGPSMRSFQLKREEASGFLTLNQRIEDDRDRLSDPWGGFFRID